MSTATASRALSRTPKRAAISAWIGSALEYYDFFIYGTAASLIFGDVFFSGLGSWGSTLASLATFGVAYVVRPLGSFVLGHLGDTYGRKLVMILTIFGIGMATFLVGCLPSYAAVGPIAPILLVLLRMLQGFAVAGEQSSASSMTLEHAPQRRRAFFSSFTLGGTQFGFILATAVFLPISSLPDDQLQSWGWRIPFWLSAVVMAVAWWIRRSLHETPAFVEEARGVRPAANGPAVSAQPAQSATPAAEAGDAPLVIVGRYYVWDVLKVFLSCLVSVTSTIVSLYALTYGTETIGIERNTILWFLIGGNVLALVAIPTWAMAADRFGRKPIFLIGALGSATMIWPYIYALSQNDLVLFGAATFLLNLFYSAYGGSGMAMFAEQFETRVRLSGMAIGTQFGFALGGFAPTIAAWLAGPDLEAWIPVAAFTCLCSAIATVASRFMRETVDAPLEELGRPRSPRSPARTVSGISTAERLA
ncbi:MAG: MFS transporter [Nocardioides sp.]|uniref:MFS transporter n=1 Tax=Nocardioides sp. TaxID=35761 RepID=UPI0039E4BF50